MGHSGPSWRRVVKLYIILQQLLPVRKVWNDAVSNGVGHWEGRRGPAGAGAPAARAGQVCWGPNDRLQADLIDFSQNTRGKTRYGLVVMDVFTRARRWAGPPSAPQRS